MSARTHNFRIGLFVLAGACLFVGALFAMGIKSYFGSRQVFETCVNGKVDNLSVGALVKLRGVTIGKVSFIDFAGTEYPEYKNQYVVIQFEVPKNFDWGAGTTNLQSVLDAEAARGLRVRVQGQGFLGANILALEYLDPDLYPVEPVPWTPKHYYIPSAANQINRVLSSLERTLHHAQDIDLADLANRTQKLLDAANRLIANINQVDFNRLGTNASSLIVDLRDTNRGLQQTLADAQGAITDARGAIKGADIPAISRDTLALEAKLSSTVVEVRRLLAGVDASDLGGSLANVRAATDELIGLLHQLDQRPAAVLFSKPPQPAPELDKPPKK